jgi:hypothetical protein
VNSELVEEDEDDEFYFNEYEGTLERVPRAAALAQSFVGADINDDSGDSAYNIREGESENDGDDGDAPAGY